MAYDEIGPVIVDMVKTLVLTGPTSEQIRRAVLAAPAYQGSPVIIERKIPGGGAGGLRRGSSRDIVFFLSGQHLL